MPQPDTGRLAFRMGIAVVMVTPLLIMWTTIVRDDSGGAAASHSSVNIPLNSMALRGPSG